MLTISKPLSASQARTYHAKEFASQQQNYWSRDQHGHSEWQGKLARQWNLMVPSMTNTSLGSREGQHPTDEETTRSASGFADLRGQERQRSHQRRTPRRVGCHVLRAEVGIDHRACRRRRPRTVGAPGERARGAGRTGAIHAGAHRKHPRAGDNRQVCCSHFRARHRPARGWICGPAVAHPCRHLQCHRARQRPDPRPAAARDLRFAALRDSRVPFGIGVASRKIGLRTRARQARPAGNQGIHKRVFGSVQPAPGTDQRPSPRARNRWSGGGADRRASYARPQRTAVAGGSLAAAPGTGRAVSATRRIEWLLRREHTVNTRRENPRSAHNGR